MPDTSRPINILLVEDDPDDVELTRRALDRAKVRNQIWTVSKGTDALAFLRGQAPADAFLSKPVDLDRLGWLVRVMANLGWAIVKTDG